MTKIAAKSVPKAKAKTKTKTKTKTEPYDVAKFLRTPEEMAQYLDAWLADAPDDVAGISRALGDIARARGMAQVAEDFGLSRESLYRALSENGNPSFATGDNSAVQHGPMCCPIFVHLWQRCAKVLFAQQVSERIVNFEFTLAKWYRQSRRCGF